MPRRRPDNVIEHRISLSDFERSKINEAVATAQANVAVDGITATLQAAGSALAGGGVLLAAVVFMGWKGPTLIAKITDKTNGILDGIVDGILPGTPIEHRRYAQELARRRGEIANQEAAFCSFDSDKYDAAKCSATFEAKDRYFHDLEAFRAMLRTTYSAGEREVIYYGLGDINPNFAN